MSWDATSYVKKLRVAPNGVAITKGEKLVLFVLADYHNDQKGYAWSSLSHLAKESLHSRRGVIMTLQALREKGIISVFRPSGSKTNHYSFPALDSPANHRTPEPTSLEPGIPVPQSSEATSLPLVKPVHHASEAASLPPVNPVHPIFPEDLSNDLSKDMDLALRRETSHGSIAKKRSTKQPKGEATYLAYAEAYFKRYRVEPVRNSRTNALMCQLVDRLGAEEAPLVAAFYLNVDSPPYVSALHPPHLLLRDCESLRTQWKTGPIRPPIVGPKAFQSVPTVKREMDECPPGAAALLSKIAGGDAFGFSSDRKGVVRR